MAPSRRGSAYRRCRAAPFQKVTPPSEPPVAKLAALVGWKLKVLTV